MVEFSTTNAPVNVLGIVSAPVGDLLLRVHGGNQSGRFIRITTPRCMVGSDSTCSLRIDDPGVQPFQCLIYRGIRGTVIRCCSPNSKLNGNPFASASLQKNDRIEFANVAIEVIETCGEPEPPPAPEPLTIPEPPPIPEPSPIPGPTTMTVEAAVNNEDATSSNRETLAATTTHTVTPVRIDPVAKALQAIQRNGFAPTAAPQMLGGPSTSQAATELQLELTRQVETLTGQLADSTGRVEELSRSLTETNSRLSEAHNALAAERQSFEGERANWTGQLSDAQNRLAISERESSDVKATLAEYEQRLATATAELRSQMDSLRSETQIVSDKNASLESQIAGLQQEIHSRNEKIEFVERKANEERESAERLLNELRQELERASQSYIDLTKELDSLRQDRDDARNEVQHWKSHCDRLESERFSAKPVTETHYNPIDETIADSPDRSLSQSLLAAFEQESRPSVESFEAPAPETNVAPSNESTNAIEDAARSLSSSLLAEFMKEEVDPYGGDDPMQQDLDRLSSSNPGFMPTLVGSPSLGNSGPGGHSGSADEEDSIQDYMNRLLQRVRGEKNAHSPSTPVPSPVESKVIKQEVAPAPPTPVEEEIIDESEYVPRRKAPELNANLALMRELANAQASHAIHKSQKNTWAKSVRSKVVLLGLSIIMSIGLLYAAREDTMLLAIGALFSASTVGSLVFKLLHQPKTASFGLENHDVRDESPT